MLAHVCSNIHDTGYNALRDETATVTDNTDSFPVTGEQGLSSITDIRARGWVGCQDAAFGRAVIEHHVDAHYTGCVVLLDSRQRGDVHTQWGNEYQGLRRGRLSGFDLRP